MIKASKQSKQLLITAALPFILDLFEEKEKAFDFKFLPSVQKHTSLLLEAEPLAELTPEKYKELIWRAYHLTKAEMHVLQEISRKMRKEEEEKEEKEEEERLARYAEQGIHLDKKLPKKKAEPKEN